MVLLGYISHPLEGADKQLHDSRSLEFQERLNSPIAYSPSHMYHYRVLVLVSQPLLVEA